MSGVAKYGVRKRRRVYPVRRRGATTRAPSRWSTYGAAGLQLARDVMYLKTLINSEPHNHYVQSANNFSWNGIIVSLSDVPAGDSDQERTGTRVLPRFLNVNWRATWAGQNTVVRVMLFRYWGEASSDGAPAVTVAEVLRTSGTQFAPYTHLNDDNTGPRGDRDRRIEVLRSVLLNLDGVARQSEVCNWDVNVNGMAVNKKEHIDYTDMDTHQPISGGFYMLFIGNVADNASYHLESKLVFYDN